MKPKKILIIATLLLIVGVSTQSFADPNWYTCTVEQVGSGADLGGTHFIYLKEANGAWGETWFILADEVSKEQLALSIVAQINNKTVLVFVDPDVPFSTVSNMYLNK